MLESESVSGSITGGVNPLVAVDRKEMVLFLDRYLVPVTVSGVCVVVSVVASVVVSGVGSVVGSVGVGISSSVSLSTSAIDSFVAFCCKYLRISWSIVYLLFPLWCGRLSRLLP